MATMTEREFFTKVIATENIADDIKTYAIKGIEKLDEKNLKRQNTLDKNQKENLVLMEQIVDTIGDGSMVASEIGKALGVSTQKASSLCVIMVKDGRLKVTDLKVKNKGTVKSYSLAN